MSEEEKARLIAVVQSFSRAEIAYLREAALCWSEERSRLGSVDPTCDMVDAMRNKLKRLERFARGKPETPS